MDSHLKKIVSSLIEGTKSRNLKWEPSARNTEYQLQLEHGIIKLDVWNSSNPFEVGESAELADITFYNSDGVEVDRYCFSKAEDKESYVELVSLHDAARRNHLKVEETLAGLFEEIERKAAGK